MSNMCRCGRSGTEETPSTKLDQFSAECFSPMISRKLRIINAIVECILNERNFLLLK